jgi:DNA-binding NarL/FixJ family response regulator
LPPLTQRELEVLRYVNLDYSNQQIAELLTIEIRTVKHHVHNILQKLQLRHRWDAARLAVEQGWLEPAGVSRTPSRIG